MIKFDTSEIGEVFEFIKEFRFFNENRYKKITLKSITYNDQVNELLKPLVGYEVKYKTDGSHKNDGQMVEYEFYFKNPKGIITIITTEMCYCVGWNHWKEENIK